MARTKPVASHDCGVSLYAPTEKVRAYRLVWTDPFTKQRCNRRHPNRDVADEWFASTVAYVKEGAAVAPSDERIPSGARTVAGLFSQLDARWEREMRSEHYREVRAGIFRNWIDPVIGNRLAVEWGADEEVCDEILGAARAVGRRPSTVQNIGSLMRTLVSTGHRKKWMPRSMNPMADVSYAAKKEVEDTQKICQPASVAQSITRCSPGVGTQGRNTRRCRRHAVFASATARRKFRAEP
jgi:hypothetical protein